MIIKTDWKGSDALTANDVNRIEGNIETNSTIADWPTATGTTTIEVAAPHFELKAGKSLTFIAGGNNNSNPTTININGLGAKNLYKANTSEAPLIKTGRAYSVWYSGTDFFVKASAEGDAQVSDVLAGKLFSNDEDTGLTGTLALTGDADNTDVLNGKTYYKNDAKSKQTGSLTLTGSALATDVMLGKTFYNTDAKLKVTGSLDYLGPMVAGFVFVYVDNKSVAVDNNLTKIKEVQIKKAGTYNVQFNIGIGLPPVGGTVEGQIYVNGVARGSLVTNNVAFQRVFEQNITISANDKIQLYCQTKGAPYSTNVDWFRIGILGNLDVSSIV
jgi:hypothetical protein